MKMTSLSLLFRAAGRLLASAVLLTLAPPDRPGDEIAAQTQNAFTVAGTVRDSAGQPVADARVFLEQAGSAKSVQTKTNTDGAFALSADRPGTYTLRAEKSGLHARAIEPFALAAGENKDIDLVLTSPSTAAMEFKDEPDFTVAGVTDWSNAGLHGSDTTSRTSETLAKETATLKSGAIDKISPDSKYKQALECREKGDYTQARELVRSALASADDADGHHLLGDLDERLGDPLDAVREYERAARMHPSEQNYFDWGAELLLHKAAQPAVEVFTKGSALHPDSARMLAGLGAAFFGAGSYDDAARRLCAASDLQPDDPAPYLFLGQMEKTVSALLPCGEEKLARFAHVQPANALANYYYAVSLCKRQKGSENSAASRQAEALLEKAVRLDPKFGEAYVQLGAIFFARNDFAEGIQAFQQAIAASPQLSEAHYRLSLAYKRIGDDARAHQEFDVYRQTRKTEAAEVDRQRSELKQFLIILKNQPEPTAPH